jgi:ribosomal protein S18 acetylase RimI-like enzyme
VSRDDAPPSVRLVPMTWDEFEEFAEESTRGFAARLVWAGLMPSEEAASYARLQLADLLPDGIATPLHLLRMVREVAPGDPVVGHVWVRVGPAEPPDEGVDAYVFDIELAEAARGRGLGTATMLAAEQAARDLGADTIRLTVFDRDVPAKRMYERLGYAADSTRGSGPNGGPGDVGTTAQVLTKAL